MSAARKKILYLGSDLELFTELESFYHNKLLSPETILLQKSESEFNHFFKIALEEMPHLIILDLSNDEEFTEEKLLEFFKQIRFFKHNSFFKEIALVGLFSSQQDIQKYLGLSLYGMSYFFVKGTENMFAFLDSYYIGFEHEVPVAHFAKAKKIDLDYAGQFISALSFVGTDRIHIETDLEFSIDDEITTHHELATGEFPRQMVIGESHDYTDFYLFNQYELEIPFCGAWDEPDETNILEDTYETWRDFALEEMELKTGRILLFIKEKAAMLDVQELCCEYTQLEIMVNRDVDTSLLRSRPDVIFLQLGESGEDDQHIYVAFSEIVLEINRMTAYEPLIVLFSSPSSKEALEKTYRYDKLVVSSLAYSQKIVALMVKSLASKLADHDPIIVRFPITKPESIIKISCPIKITSLTEHYITFYADKGIPMYSLFTMSMPVDMIITIVPQIDFLLGKGDQEHYLGVINGISTEQRAVLRRFVNYLIHNRPAVFDWVEPEENEEDEQSAIEVESVELQPPQERQEVLLERDLRGKELNSAKRSRKYEGKSKL